MVRPSGAVTKTRTTPEWTSSRTGVLTLPVRHRPGGNRYRAGARHELVESVAWKPTQVRPRQRKAHPSIHSRILTEAWKQGA
jgi:hypothetical protein